ncbi:protein phosphatase 2C domain-containing protein [Microbulbifer sp. NBRC 101763]|uniref:PP2C family protein-serine/threonine phosphatase n=1 Tax=Microbulbifer sp. NBRC 101763 TaxID=1113820 RepID=UPI00333EE921
MRSVPDSGISSIPETLVTLASDIGLVRTENQDRLAMLRVNTDSARTHPFIVIALADGMGGMRDGAECASLTLASFFNALVRYRQKTPKERLALAAVEANEEVYKYQQGKGGSTLSALLLDGESRAFTVNVGDSRIYAVSQEGHEPSSIRLTVDDSLEEAVGGHGKELLQFIGMGQGLIPHTSIVNRDVDRVALTSDGVHFISSVLLSDVLLHAKTSKELAEQLLTVSKWRGAPDNASVASIFIKEFPGLPIKKPETSVEILDPFGSLHIMWAKQDFPDAKELVAEDQERLQVPQVEGKDPKIKNTPDGMLREQLKKRRRNKVSEIKEKATQLSFDDDPKVEIVFEPNRDNEKGDGSKDDNS